jgi:hypothetical protein
LRGLALASLAAGAWYALTLLGLTPTRYPVPGAALATFGWLGVNVVLLLLAILRVRSLRFAGERRATHRFQTAHPGRFAGTPGAIVDLSLTGARIVLDRPAPVQASVLVVDVLPESIALDAVVRSERDLGEGEVAVGIEFLPGQDVARSRLALALFAATLAGDEAAAAVRPARSPEPLTGPAAA